MRRNKYYSFDDHNEEITPSKLTTSEVSQLLKAKDKTAKMANEKAKMIDSNNINNLNSVMTNFVLAGAGIGFIFGLIKGNKILYSLGGATAGYLGFIIKNKIKK